MSDTRTPADRAYAAERDGTLYTKPAETFTIAAQEYLADEQAVADEPLVTVEDGAGADSDWTDYTAGDVMITKQQHGYVPSDQTPFMVEISGTPIEAPWMLETITQLHTESWAHVE
jgi:hypothetical protein